MGDLIERFKESLDKGMNVVSVKSKELLEATRIGAQIGRLAEAKREALAELGTLVYAVYLAEEAALDPRITAQCAKIKEIEEEIARKEEELKEVRREAKRSLGIPLCAGCGQELAEGDRFCRACGRKVE